MIYHREKKMGSSHQEGKEVKPRRRHSKEFKQEAVRLSQQPGISVALIANDLGISRSMLSTWARNLREAGIDAFRGNGNRAQLEEQNAALRHQIRKLEQERDILKKRPLGSRRKASEVRIHRISSLLMASMDDV
jgi:transposase